MKEYLFYETRKLKHKKISIPLPNKIYTKTVSCLLHSPSNGTPLPPSGLKIIKISKSKALIFSLQDLFDYYMSETQAGNQQEK
jgi:hypothetical protein